MLEVNFNPNEAEPRLYELWERADAFRPRANGEAYCLVLPPPNVTGSLHIGHAFNSTLQDVLARFERLRGKAVLWQPGTDHAGIATQMVVERELAKEGDQDRRSLGRDAFLERVWAWKEQSGGRILEQLRRLGASADWSRERFTLDEGVSAAVRRVFVELYRLGLVYRDKRLVNWDPQFETAISDLEVVNEERDGFFWHFKYPLEGGETYQFPIAFDEAGSPVEWETRDYISIATTRPETMLGDGAVAVHPADARYAPIVGKRCLLPLADRLIPIIADEYPDPNFGSGAVKITGAHDFNDYKVARRHGLELFELLDTRARLLDRDYIPAKYRGLDRFEARTAIVADIEERGLLLQVEPKKVSQPIGDRSGVVIEPFLTDQWYVDAPKLAVAAMRAVDTGETRFHPKAWEKTYFEWLRNIEPWCVSRQLWWGHRIPAWFAPDGSTFVALTEEEARTMAEQALGRSVALSQDPDVLDTWFSSALWPFSTLGWPEQTPELARFYPNTVLVTAFDIIFFWVARMMMMGCQFLDQAPFKDVYIHALVRDEHGAKMSKSKGNVLDPLTLVDKYGADALRFTMTALAAPGRDVKLAESRIEGYRNFGTKLWNAARFCQMNECVNWEPFEPQSAKLSINRWIIGETAKATTAITKAIEEFRFHDAASGAYQFVWNVFCDWYVEFIKPVLNGDDEAAKTETRRSAAWALDRILVLLHPMMPFITEELWQRLAEYGPPRSAPLILADWPQPTPDWYDPAATAEIQWLIDLISEVRSIRSELNVPAGARIPLLLVAPKPVDADRLVRYATLIDRLSRLEYSISVDAAPAGSVSFVLGEATFALPLQGLIDVAQETERLAKEIKRRDAEIEKSRANLENPRFANKAPPEVVEEHRERLKDAAAARDRLVAALARLSALA